MLLWPEADSLPSAIAFSGMWAMAYCCMRHVLSKRLNDVESGKTQKADGLSKVLGWNLQVEFVTTVGLGFSSYV